MIERNQVLKDLINEGKPKEFDQNNIEMVTLLENLFWDGLCKIEGDFVSLSPMGEEFARKIK